ncbi:MAG: CDP-alcohol phosphatidyltransferase family protein [Propionibacteriaceae bacterium]|nr:CDP-alcohol phosphatidyltransferase family protein [Propionibacteriaceae bacterium]
MNSVEPTQEWDTDRLCTVPNALSFLRLLAVPVFGWLILVGHDMAAVILLAISGATDWLDGFLARRLNQTSELGARLDPIADRLYILTALLALAARWVVPWWFLVLLVARDAMLVGLLPSLRRSGRLALPVSLVGKAGTMLLLLAFPLILIGSPRSMGIAWVAWIGWPTAVGGAIAYWVAGADYVARTVRLARTREIE